MEPLLYGMNNASHDFTQKESLGKNIFTNAFPLALGQYLSERKDLEIPKIQATVENDKLDTEHVKTKWSSIIGAEASDAFFHFEKAFVGYDQYTHTSANPSDVVVSSISKNKEVRALEIKLVVAPTSATANRPYAEQSCEIVVRPSTVEQLAFSIAHSYGSDKRYELQQLIVDALGQPSNYKWSDEDYMLRALPQILDAAENIIRGGIEIQTPLVLVAIWRSEGQKPVLQKQAFDLFAWTDLAFLQLFTDQLKRDISRGASETASKSNRTISRPSRSLIWLIRSLFDYTVQQTLDFSSIRSVITFGVQTDKAGAFSGNTTLERLKSDEFYKPRVERNELSAILSADGGSNQLMPERRLDQAITIHHLAQELSEERDISQESDE